VARLLIENMHPVLTLLLLFATISANTIERSSNNHAEAARFVATTFAGELQSPPDSGYLLSQLTDGTIFKNMRQGHTLQIAHIAYAQGIHCPLRRNPDSFTRAGKGCTAVVGVDSAPDRQVITEILYVTGYLAY
jgi:hypothetical protein